MTMEWKEAYIKLAERIRELHFSHYSEYYNASLCHECDDDFPCATLKALDVVRQHENQSIQSTY